jgi:hypothetical protein
MLITLVDFTMELDFLMLVCFSWLNQDTCADMEIALQQIGPLTSGSFYGGVASYPLEGGYLYFCPTGGPLYAYKYGLNQTTGRPQFSFAGSGGTGLACNGNPTITSNNGKPGSAVVSVTLISTRSLPTLLF